MDARQRKRVSRDPGFVAALDQSGGSTPQALEQYGIARNRYSTDEEMFDLVHGMRARIMTSPSFDGDRIIGAILFAGTMDRELEGLGSAQFLWQRKHIVPFLKVDQGLAEPRQGVRLMKPIDGLDDLLGRASQAGVFGTKMRSVVQYADELGIAAVLDQQFDVASRILEAGLVPILEPEVDVRSPQKPAAEEQLRAGIAARLAGLADGARVMLKLSLPSKPGFYDDFVRDDRVLRVLALSGGHRRDGAVRLLAANPGLVASFSRALLEGLSSEQSDADFDAALDTTIAEIYAASTT